jgi:hypothetical protein
MAHALLNNAILNISSAVITEADFDLLLEESTNLHINPRAIHEIPENGPLK